MHLVETAAEAAIQASIRSGDAGADRPGRARRARAARSGRRRAPWFSTAYNYALYANDGGEYDDLLAYIRKHKLL